MFTFLTTLGRLFVNVIMIWLKGIEIYLILLELTIKITIQIEKWLLCRI